MAQIVTYPTGTPKDGDYLIGTSVPPVNSDDNPKTRNFSVSDITALGPQGTVTSVALTMPAAFSVAGSPVTSAGTFAVTGAGSNAQFVDGTGALQTIANLPFIDGTGIANRVPFFVDADTISSSGLIYTTTGGGSATNLPLYAFSGSADISCARIITQDIFCNDIQASGGGTVTLKGNTIIGDANTDALTVNATSCFSSSIKILGVPVHADNAAALAAGLTAGEVYRTGDLLKIVH